MGINSEYYKEKNKKRLTKLKEIEKASASICCVLS